MWQAFERKREEEEAPLLPRARFAPKIPFPFFFERLPRTLIYSQPLLNVIYIFSFYSFFVLAFSSFLFENKVLQDHVKHKFQTQTF